MAQGIRAALVTVFAGAGALVFLWYVWAAGQVTLANPSAPADIKPAELVGFGIAFGTLLATNLGTVLGIAIKSETKSLRALAASQVTEFAGWTQIIAAAFYVICLVLAIGFYWKSGWSTSAVEVLRTSLATLFGVLLGAGSAVLSPK